MRFSVSSEEGKEPLCWGGHTIVLTD